MSDARATGERLRALLGWLFALAGLIWVFHDLRFHDLREAVRDLNWAWIPLAVACDITNYLVQGGRWGLLLRPVGRISLARMTGVVYAGLFINEILPLRLGEVLRTWLISRRLSVGLSRVVPSIVVERLMDGIWLALAIALVAAFVPLPESLVRAGDLLGILVLLGVGVFLLMVLRRRSTGETGPETGELRGFLRHQAEGVRAIGLSSGFWGAFALTGLMLLLQGSAFWLVLRGCRVHLHLFAGIAVFLIVHFGTAIPNAPGNVGSYQFFCVLGLALFGVEKAQAAAFSVVVFVVLTLPLWALGYLGLRANGLSLREARRRLARSPAEPHLEA